MLKKNGGITLIALVITIIVLLILAGVSIAMLSGENGLLNRTTNAADKEVLAGAKDVITSEVAGLVEDYYEARYVKGTSNDSTAAPYIKTQLNTSSLKEEIGLRLNPYKCNMVISDNGGTVTVKLDKSKVNAVGTITAEGTITWVWGTDLTSAHNFVAVTKTGE